MNPLLCIAFFDWSNGTIVKQKKNKGWILASDSLLYRDDENNYEEKIIMKLELLQLKNFLYNDIL